LCRRSEVFDAQIAILPEKIHLIGAEFFAGKVFGHIADWFYEWTKAFFTFNRSSNLWKTFEVLDFRGPEKGTANLPQGFEVSTAIPPEPLKMLIRYFAPKDYAKSDSYGMRKGQRPVKLVGGGEPITATRESPVRGAFAALIRPDGQTLSIGESSGKETDMH
jgi:hypothetical protein